MPKLTALRRRLEIVGINALDSDEYSLAAGARRLLNETRDLVARHVDFNRQANLDPFPLVQLDQPIENRLPVLVPREVIVGDEIRS